MFDSAKLKVERADHHIAELERQLIAFTRQSLDTCIRTTSDRGLDLTYTAIPPPANIALTISDAVHNLWTSLDHVTWETVGFDKGKQHRQLYFPKGKDRPSYEGMCEGIETPSAIIKDLFKSLEAFPGGKGEFLYIAYSLDRADKHTVLTPVVHAPTTDELVVVAEGGNVKILLSDLYGGIATLDEGETFTIVGAPRDSALEFKNDVRISPHILFGNVEFVEGRAILPTIRHIRDAVAEAIKIIESSVN